MMAAGICFIVGICIGAWVLEGFYKDAAREGRAVLLDGKIYKLKEVKDDNAGDKA